MAVKLSDMATNEKSVEVTGGALGDEVLHVTYYPNRVTTEAINVLDGSLDGMNTALAGILKSWDVLNDDDTMYPLDADSLARLGIAFLRQVAWAILADIRPN